MSSTRRVRPLRTNGFGRILAAGLVLSALLAAFPLPAQAVPVAGDAGPVAGLVSWLEGVLAGFGFAPAAPGGPEARFLPDGCGMDPLGGTCGENKAPAPVTRAPENAAPQRPVTK